MHSHPLGRSEATPTPCPTTTPFNAFRPVPGGALYTVFTATLGLIKGLSVSRLGCEPRTPGHSRGRVLQGRGWAQRGLPHPGAQSAHCGAQVTATPSAQRRGPACCLSSPTSLGDPLFPRQTAAVGFAGWGSSTWSSGAQGALPAHVYQEVASVSPILRRRKLRFKVSKEFG